MGLIALSGGGFEVSAAGLLGSIVGALIVLWVWRRTRHAPA